MCCFCPWRRYGTLDEHPSCAAVVSTAGSCACFTLSRLIGRSLARAIWPEQLAKYALEVRPL